MLELHPVVNKWFECWRGGKLDTLPIAEDFTHTSPFGIIKGKNRYMEIVFKNKKDFLNNQLTVTKQICQDNQVCVQFEQKNNQTGLEMTVCEWYEIRGELISQIRSFYNIGDAKIVG